MRLSEDQSVSVRTRCSLADWPIVIASNLHHSSAARVAVERETVTVTRCNGLWRRGLPSSTAFTLKLSVAQSRPFSEKGLGLIDALGTIYQF